MLPKTVILDQFETSNGPIVLLAFTNSYGRTSYRVEYDDPFSFCEFYDLDHALGLFFHSVDEFRHDS